MSFLSINIILTEIISHVGQFQTVISASSTVFTLSAGVWFLLARLGAKQRFNAEVKVQMDKQIEEKQRIIIQRDQELKSLSIREDEIIKRISDRTDAYAKDLERQMDDLKKRVDVLEVDNRNLVRENLLQARYITICIDKFESLGVPIPSRPKEFNVD